MNKVTTCNPILTVQSPPNLTRILPRYMLACAFAIIVFWAMPKAVFADSPPNLTDNILWDGDANSDGAQAQYDSVADVQNAFNNARRQEELQLGLAANTLGQLVLPAQGDWDGLSSDERALLLINAERNARANVAANVLGLPLERVESNVDTIAQTYAQLLLDTDTFSHVEDGTPFARLDRVFGQPASPNACREFMSRAENIAAFVTSGDSIPMAVERAIYGWLYVDAGASWGHREAVLLQDRSLNNPPVPPNMSLGYKNNVAGEENEGYLGIGVAAGSDYTLNGQSWNYGVVVVMNIVDPANNPGCPPAVDAATPTAESTSTPISTAPTSVPGDTATPDATSTPISTAPTAEPTATVADTSTPIPTAPTSEPTATSEETATPIPTAPTSEPTATAENTPTPVATEPTPEDTVTPNATSTPISTAPTSEPTATTEPTTEPTSTPISTAPTATPAVTATETSVPPTPGAGKANITIVLEVNPATDLDFKFYGAFGSFDLDAEIVNDGDEIPNSITYANVNPGTYSFSEVYRAPWQVAEIRCSSSDRTENDLKKRLVTIRPQAGDNIVCTFVNKHRVNIEARSYDDANGDGEKQIEEQYVAGWALQFYDDQGNQVFQTVSDETGTARKNNLSAGSYKVCVVSQSGWTTTQPAETDSATGLHCYQLDLEPASAAILEFGNTQGSVNLLRGEGGAASEMTIYPLSNFESEPAGEEEVEANNRVYLPSVMR